LAAILKDVAIARGAFGESVSGLLKKGKYSEKALQHPTSGIPAMHAIMEDAGGSKALKKYTDRLSSHVDVLDTHIAALSQGPTFSPNATKEPSSQLLIIRAGFNAIDLLRSFRSKDEDGTKHGFWSLGSHAAEVLRKQIVPLSVLGLYKSEGPQGVIVGAGDSNLPFVKGLNALLTDVRANESLGVVKFDALIDKIDPAKVYFSDAYASSAAASEYWSTRVPDHISVRSGANGTSVGTTPMTPFLLSFCFAHRFAESGVESFAAKVILGEESVSYLAALNAKYVIHIFPGGRGHNCEVFLRCLKRTEDNPYTRYGPLSEGNWRAILVKYVHIAVSVNLRRLRAELTFDLTRYAIPPFVMPGVFYMADGKLKNGLVRLPVDYAATVELVGSALRSLYGGSPARAEVAEDPFEFESVSETGQGGDTSPQYIDE